MKKDDLDIKKFPFKKTILIIVFLLCFVALIVGAFFASRQYMIGRFLPGTSIAGIDVSYKNIKDVNVLLNTELYAFSKREIVFTFNDKNTKVLPKDLGIEIFLDDSIAAMKTVSATDFSVFDFFKEEGLSYDLIVKLDVEKFYSILDEEFSFTASLPVPANFYFDEDFNLLVSEPVDGIVIDTDSLMSDLTNIAKNLSSNSVNISFEKKSPNTKAEDVEAQRENIEKVLSHTVTIIDPVYSDDWYVKLYDYLDWVNFVVNDEEKKVLVDVNYDALNVFVDEEISQWLDKEVGNVKAYFDENDEVVIEGTGKDGKEIQREQMREELSAAFNNFTEEVTVPVKDLPAILDFDERLVEMGIRERISQGHTSYYHSSGNRIHNIKVGSAKFSGLIIQPGEEFSFLDNLGAVNGATGYRQELVIKAEGTIPEYGGGLCQVSTTMYRTALFGGLEITDRRPHSYAVSYYSQIMGHGLDATIYVGGQDLKFVNDTEYPFLIHTYVDDDYELYINFYGTSDGRSVELDGPVLYGYRSPGAAKYIESPKVAPGQTKQVEISHTGFSADWNYKLTTGDGEVIDKTLNTTYRAIPAKILVGKEVAAE